MNREDAIKLVRRHIEPEACDEVIADLRPAIGMVPTRDADVANEVAVSRMAGPPDVPADFEWPKVELDQHLSEQERKAAGRQFSPLRFLLQVNLAEFGGLPAYDELPKHGMLSVFFNTEQPWLVGHRKAGAVRVYYFEDTSRLATAKMPKFVDGVPEYHPCRIEIVERWSPQDLSEMTWTVRGKEDESCWNLIAALSESRDHDIGGGTRHYLLGHPQSVQDDVRYEWHLERNGRNATFPRTEPAREGYSRQIDTPQTRSLKKWRLLFEIDSDEKRPHWMWGDDGRLYIGLLEEELKQRQFDKCELVWQSH